MTDGHSVAGVYPRRQADGRLPECTDDGVLLLDEEAVQACERVTGEGGVAGVAITLAGRNNCCATPRSDHGSKIP